MMLGIQNRLIGQQVTYAMSYSKGFFSIYLESCDCYSMQVVGDKVILGTENHEDFIANKKLLITKYQEKVNKLGKYDTTVGYEIDKRNSGDVIFYFYKTGISGSIPTGKFALSEGYYTVEIFKKNLLASSIANSIKNNIITKL
jgi:hypothetical protein